MPDPRILRTHLHVLDVVRSILASPDAEPLTFTLLAREAQVSRRTLYVHWGTVDRVLSEAARQSLDIGEQPWPEAPRDRLAQFLTQVRDGSDDPVVKAAIGSLMSLAAHDASAANSLVELTSQRIALFSSLIAPVTEQQYAEIIGPMYFIQFATRKPVSDAFLETLIERGAVLLGLGFGAEPATPLGEAA